MQSPGDRPVKSRKLVTSALPAPLKTLTIDRDGNLQIPSDSYIAETLRFPIGDQGHKVVQELRKEFPESARPAEQAAQPAQPESPVPGSESALPVPADDSTGPLQLAEVIAL